VPVNIAPGAGDQHTPGYHAVNPQRMVPVLVDGERVVRQSLAIVEYLDESYGGARLLPVTARERARARSLALVVACDIHPLNNTRVLQWLESEFNTPQVERERWVRHWIETGLEALEELLAGNPSTGAFCEGDSPSIADICLAPQCYNAQRFMVDLTRYPTVRRIYEQCLTVPAFDRARPENQPDAPRG
jgi:maleylacetoacetate isomerase